MPVDPIVSAPQRTHVLLVLVMKHTYILVRVTHCGIHLNLRNSARFFELSERPIPVNEHRNAALLHRAPHFRSNQMPCTLTRPPYRAERRQFCREAMLDFIVVFYEGGGLTRGCGNRSKLLWDAQSTIAAGCAPLRGCLCVSSGTWEGPFLYSTCPRLSAETLLGIIKTAVGPTFVSAMGSLWTTL